MTRASVARSYARDNFPGKRGLFLPTVGGNFFAHMVSRADSRRPVQGAEASLQQLHGRGVDVRALLDVVSLVGHALQELRRQPARSARGRGGVSRRRARGVLLVIS